MANEITVQTSLKVTNGNAKALGLDALNQSFDQAAEGGPTPGYVSIGTLEESHSFGELSTLGWMIMQNNDSTNYVQWGFTTGDYGGRLEPGERAVFRLEPGATLYLKANTAACKMIIYAFED